MKTQLFLPLSICIYCHEIVEFEKMCALIVKHPCNLSAHYIIEISSIYIIYILFLETRRELYFILIIILTRNNLTNYIPIIG